jgi:type I restriction enzyme S subunit
MFVADMVKKATGASYPAVSDRIVLDSWMPMPGLDEQLRIADILDKADAIRRKRKEAIALTEELLRSAFLEMFGNR